MKLFNLLKIDFDDKRNYGLDILRFSAIIFVVIQHSTTFVTNHFLLNTLTSYNLDGVALFFVLSGFLIGGILISQLETNKPNIRILFNFWIKRWFRTLPSFFLILTILVILGIYFKTIPKKTPIFHYYTFITNFRSTLPDFLFPESWSLNIEEWFYLLIPILLYAFITIFRLRVKHSVLMSAIIIIVFTTCFRYYRFTLTNNISYNDIDLNFRKEVITRLDSLMYGVIGAFLVKYYFTLWKKWKKSLFFTGIFLLYFNIFLCFTGSHILLYSCVFSFGVQSLGFLFLFPYITEIKSGSGFWYKNITRISLISYSIYLINNIIVKLYIMHFFNNYLFKNFELFHASVVQYLSYWIITILGAAFLYKYFEKPTTNLRNLIVSNKS